MAHFETWENEKQRYELKPAGEFTTALAYHLKESEQEREQPHMICQNCYQDRKKSILQFESRMPGRAEVLVCHRCNNDIYTIGHWQPEHSGGKSRGKAGTFGR